MIYLNAFDVSPPPPSRVQKTEKEIMERGTLEDFIGFSDGARASTLAVAKNVIIVEDLR